MIDDKWIDTKLVIADFSREEGKQFMQNLSERGPTIQWGGPGNARHFTIPHAARLLAQHPDIKAKVYNMKVEMTIEEYKG